MESTIHPLRKRGAVTWSFISMFSMILFALFIAQTEAYRSPLSHTHARKTKGAKHELFPMSLFEQHKTIDRSRVVLSVEERSTSTSDDSQKKKRRRKPSPATSSIPPPQSTVASIRDFTNAVDQVTINPIQDNRTKVDLAMMNEIAKFEFQGKLSDDDTTVINLLESQSPSVSNAILLPDIKEARKRKQMEEEMARIQQQQDEQKVKIKRTDKEAFRRLLEQQPFADADESYFEEEQYGAVSALLGERAKPFLSIPLGPLQVGHFIGSLVFVLMAYVEYPGFPLTNLPTPLRECFQGGLGFVYAINTILAVIVAVKVAPDRGQPTFLWIMKTFTVGGLSFDQLMQLPTMVEIDKAKSLKGARAIKKKPSTR